MRKQSRVKLNTGKHNAILLMNMPTFDCEGDVVGDALALCVEDVAGVAAGVGAGDALDHQALVADDDARAHVVRQSLALNIQNYWIVYPYIIVQLLLRFCSLSYLDLDRFIQDLHDCEGGWGEGYAWFAFKIEKSLYYKLLRDGAFPGH